MKKKIGLIILAVAVTAVAVTGNLILRRKININPILADGYEIHGVDVSHYQGTVDWEKMEEQDLHFAMIKATEGSGHLDECFYTNWEDAAQTGLCIGAYHFLVLTARGRNRQTFILIWLGT